MRRLAALFFSILVASAVVSFTPIARAQQASDADRAAARELFNKGVELQNAQKFPEALDHFERAQKVVNAPTNLLHIGQCQAALGRLVEAAEAFRATARYQMPSNAPAPFVAAQNEATTQLSTIEPRIPELKINVQPKDIPTLTITVDDQPVNAALVGASRPVNPGTHKVSASAPGYTKAERTVDLKEKQKIEVTLSLVSTGGVVYGPTGTGDTGPTNPPPAGSASAAPSASASSGPPPPPPPRDPRSKMSVMLGARLGFTAMAGNLPSGKTGVDDTSIGDVAGPGGQLGIEAAFRFIRILYISLTGDVAGYAGKDAFSQNNGAEGSITGSSQLTSGLLGGHFGILTNPEGFGFMGDLGLGYRYVDLKGTVTIGGTSTTTDENYAGIDYMIRVGMHFKAGKYVRLFPQAELDFGSLSVGGGTDINGQSIDGSAFTGSAGHVSFLFAFGGYFDIDLDKGAGKAPTLDTTVK